MVATPESDSYQPHFLLERAVVGRINLAPIQRGSCVKLLHYLLVYLEEPERYKFYSVVPQSQTFGEEIVSLI